jgi:DNA repair protein RecO (recombination protein O)
MPKSRLFNVDAIILRRSDFDEADRVLTVFTAERGKLRLLAKGARKTTSRKSGHIELFTHATLQVAEGRTWGIVSQAETVESFRALREDLDKISQAYYLAELVDKFSEENDPSFPLFELAVLTLARLNDSPPATTSMAMRFFDLHLLRLTGYQPQLHFCIACNKPLEAEDSYFHPGEGGVFCPNCGATRPGTQRLSLGALKVLRFLQTRSWEEAARLHLTPATQHEVEKTLLDYITHILERKLKSVDFLRKLRQNKKVMDEAVS